MPFASIPGRAVISVSGPDAQSFLQNVVTSDLDALEPGTVAPSALLTPQGKILFDFLVFRSGDAEIGVDCRTELAADLAKRLTLYRLRAKVAIDVRSDVPVTASWQEADADAGGRTDSYRDTRFPRETSVFRIYGSETGSGDPGLWDAIRVAHGVAESGIDFAVGDAFPHDVLLDQNGGVGLRKGCYVGQEVVSRMQHRGTARRRILIARSDMPFPPPGTEVLANARSVGTLGTVAGAEALALVRIDRVAEAREAGLPIRAGDAELDFRLPPNVTFGFPSPGAASAE